MLSIVLKIVKSECKSLFGASVLIPVLFLHLLDGGNGRDIPRI